MCDSVALYVSSVRTDKIGVHIMFVGQHSILL